MLLSLILKDNPLTVGVVSLSGLCEMVASTVQRQAISKTVSATGCQAIGERETSADCHRALSSLDLSRYLLLTTFLPHSLFSSRTSSLTLTLTLCPCEQVTSLRTWGTRRDCQQQVGTWTLDHIMAMILVMADMLIMILILVMTANHEQGAE